MPEPKRPLKVFLCHAKEDKQKVRELYRRLVADGVDAWLDEEKLLPGMDWRVEIPKAVHDADVVIVCLSKDSISKKGYVQKEIIFALDAADENPEGVICIIPTKLEECDVPARLSRWQWVNYFSIDGYGRLVRSLEIRATSLDINWKAEISTSSPKRPETLKEYQSVDSMILDSRKIFNTTIEFIHIPAGKFIMGSKDDNSIAFDDEFPQHTLELPEYWMARYPVTNQQFATFVQNTSYRTTAQENGVGYAFDGKRWVDLKGVNWMNPRGSKNNIEDRQDNPVVMISWYDAMAYCRWLSELLQIELPRGLVLRLPSEAQWEKAARGEHGNEWPWGNKWDATCCNSRDNGSMDTKPIGQYSPRGDSPYGVADMVGNIWEWTLSQFDKYPYVTNDGREDVTVTAPRVLRGGSFYCNFSGTRTASRYGLSPDGRHGDFGFRVALTT